MSRTSSSWNLRLPLASLLLSLPLVAAGCAPSLGTVSGKVTYKDVPLKGGSVSFMNADRTGFARAQINTDGSYTAEGVPLGEVKISVETNSVRPVALPKGVQLKPPAGANAPDVNLVRSADRYVKIPPQYSNPDMSGLTYTVTSGSQTKNIELK